MSFKFKVYDAAGEHLATCKREDEALRLAALLGDGATIRSYSQIIWTHGAEDVNDTYNHDCMLLVVMQRQRKAEELAKN